MKGEHAGVSRREGPHSARRSSSNAVVAREVVDEAPNPPGPMPEVVSPGNAARWRSEAEFFDRQAEGELAGGVAPFSEAVLRRYVGRELRARRCKDFRFLLLGDLRGKKVLDVGCGDGANAALLALCGAEVVGVDVSPLSIELATRRAEANGVSSRVRFVCSPIEHAPLDDGTFDVIWGDGVLHHVIPELDSVLMRLRRSAKRGARVVFWEPLCLWAWLRRLRKHIPVHTDATPDERPLSRAELAILRRHFPDLELKFFDAFGRLTRFVLGPAYDYEGASWPRRLGAEMLFVIDAQLLSIPALAPLGGSAVVFATAR